MENDYEAKVDLAITIPIDDVDKDTPSEAIVKTVRGVLYDAFVKFGVDYQILEIYDEDRGVMFNIGRDIGNI